MPIMRRTLEHFRRQDWTAVVVELVVVILGVFIGLQASNWNEDLERDRKADSFTQRLKTDLREEAWGYEFDVEYFNEVLANAERTADALSGKTPLSDEALLIAAFRATQFNENIRRRATYDELTSTGEIGLIDDPALRDLAMRNYTSTFFDDLVREGKDSEYRKAFRMAVPYEVQQVLDKSCGDRVVLPGDYKGMTHVLDYSCTTGLSPATIAANAAILRTDPRFAQLLRLRIIDIGTGLANLTVYSKTLRDGLHAVAQDTP